MYKVLQKNLTTSTTSQDIIPILQTYSDYASNTELPFTIRKIIFHAQADTKVKVNSSTQWTDLRYDLVDGLYKIELDLNDVCIKTFVVQDTAIDYFVEILY